MITLPPFFWNCITASYLVLIFVISLLIKIVELHPLSNNIWKSLNFDLLICIFIHPCRIGKQWLFIFLVRLEIFSIPSNKLHSAILFISLTYMYHIFQAPYIIKISEFSFKHMNTSLFWLAQRLNLSNSYRYFS